MTDKTEYLKSLYNQFGDYDLFYAKGYEPENKKMIPGWSGWKKFSECSDIDLEESNLRSVFKEEIILDIEDPSKIDSITEELDSIPVNYLSFSTGSRGFHIDIIFPKLRETEPNQVTEIKKSIIQYFGGDISKKAEHNLIALEYEPHFKTGNVKLLHKSRMGMVKENDTEMFLAMTVKLGELKRKDPKFTDIYNGNWQNWFPGKTRSEAEQSLCNILAIEGFQPKEINEIMINAKVGKWNETHPQYKMLTISKAMEFAKQLIESRMTQEKPMVPSEEMFKYFEQYGVPEPVTWLLDHYLPTKGICIISGATGSGKSFITEELMSALSNNRKLFNALPLNNPDDRPIILIDGENDHSTLYERMMKLGGLPEKRVLMFNINENFDIQDEFMINELMKWVETINPCLVIFDTLRRTYYGDENDSKVINFIYKTVLAPVSKKRCVIVVAHTRKSATSKFANTSDEISEIRGTGDITGIASVVLMVQKNEDLTMTIKPLKMRPAKLPERFTVKIEEIDEKLFMEFLGKTETLVTIIDVVEKAMETWLIHNIQPNTIIKTKEIVDAMRNDGHKDRRVVAKAINRLSTKGLLLKQMRGQYKFQYGNIDLTGFTKDDDDVYDGMEEEGEK